MRLSHKSVNQPINRSKVWRQNDLKSPMTLGSYSNRPKLPTSWWANDFVCFVFFRNRVSLCSPGCFGTHLCKPGWLQTQRSTCLCLPSSGTEGLHHARLSWCLLKTQASKQTSPTHLIHCNQVTLLGDKHPVTWDALWDKGWSPVKQCGSFEEPCGKYRFCI